MKKKLLQILVSFGTLCACAPVPAGHTSKQGTSTTTVETSTITSEGESSSSSISSETVSSSESSSQQTSTSPSTSSSPSSSSSSSPSSNTPSSSSSSEIISSSDPTVHVTSITLGKERVDLEVGETYVLTYSVLPLLATDKSVTFDNDNPDVASFDEETKTVTALSDGTAHITVTTVDGGLSKTLTVNVTSPIIPVLNKTSLRYSYMDYTAHAGGISSCPCLGEPRLLIIPIWFTDSSSYITSTSKEKVRQDIEACYLGTNEETGWRSVSSFYEEESGGRCKIDGTVSEWYEVGQRSSSYYSERTGPGMTQSLAQSAADWYFDNHPTESPKDYDTDGDGYLDGVILIYGAADYSTTGNNNAGNMWAYCYWTGNTKNKMSPTANVYFWASYDFMYGSNKASSRTGKSYAGGNTSYCNLDTHTFIHEMGHVLGLDDYYDYSYQYNPAAGFSMQDYNVGGHDPYSVMAYGWADPYIPTESCEITIKDFQSSKDVILLTPSWNNDDSPFDEYILLELYTPTGLNKFDVDHMYSSSHNDQGPNAVGIRAWHVDGRLTYPTSSGYYPTYSTSLITNPTAKSTVVHAMSNTYNDEDYGSPLGSSYYNYNLLQLIRNSTTETYKPTSFLKASHLFKENDTFTVEGYKNQFVKSTKLNSGKGLGWTAQIKEITSSNGKYTATISLTKAA